MTLGDAKEFTRWLGKQIAVLMLLYWACLTVLHLLPFPRDSTDGKWPNRSDMRPLRDALTGCEYLRTKGGGITPRIDARGRHFGCKGIEAEIE
jgi:hypothetical protein